MTMRPSQKLQDFVGPPLSLSRAQTVPSQMPVPPIALAGETLKKNPPKIRTTMTREITGIFFIKVDLKSLPAHQFRHFVLGLAEDGLWSLPIDCNRVHGRFENVFDLA